MNDMGPEVMEIAKVGGGVGTGALVVWLLTYFMGGQNKVIERIDALAAQVQQMSTQLAVLVAKSDAREADLLRLDAKVAEHSLSIATLQAKVEHLGSP